MDEETFLKQYLWLEFVELPLLFKHILNNMNLHRPLVAFLFFIGVYASTSAQFRRDTISSTTTWAIQFTSEEVGYVVGNSGTAFKTTNRGKSWQTLTTGFT